MDLPSVSIKLKVILTFSLINTLKLIKHQNKNNIFHFRNLLDLISLNLLIALQIFFLVGFYYMQWHSNHIHSLFAILSVKIIHCLLMIVKNFGNRHMNKDLFKTSHKYQWI